MTETLEKLRELVKEQFGEMNGPAPTDDQDLFYDAMATNADDHRKQGGYGLDSLDAVELCMLVEDAFDLDQIPDDVASSEEFKTVAGIARYVDRQHAGEEKAGV